MWSLLYDWRFWLVFCVVALVVLWIFFGGEKHYHYGPDKETEEDLPERHSRSGKSSRSRSHSRSRSRSRERPRPSRHDYVMIPETPPPGVEVAGMPNPVMPQVPRHYQPVAGPAPVCMSGQLFSSREVLARPDIYRGPPELPPQFQGPSPGPTKMDKPSSKKEALAKEAVKRIYGVEFKKVLPEWLVNPKTGRRLEIDLYNEELKLGVEVHGEQHYFFNSHFHRTEQDFLRQVERDQLKLDICDQRGVYIITVPYNVPDHLVEDYIRYWDPTVRALREAREAQVQAS